MKIGVFDSGFGGLLIARSIKQEMPELDLVYLGDTLHLPYGSRSDEAIYGYSKACMEALFEQGCALIIMACNTASARALRRLQQEYLPRRYPDRRILGVVVPTIEEALERGAQKIGVIGTNYTIHSAIYKSELEKISPEVQIFQQATPLLVPLIEQGGEKWLDDVLDDYLAPLKEAKIEALLLGCTHYAALKDRIRHNYNFDVMSQDEIIPKKLGWYLNKHEWLAQKIQRNGSMEIFVTDMTPHYERLASTLFSNDVRLSVINNSKAVSA